MKELSIEEKAKRYDEAIIRAKSLIGDTIIEESGQHIAEVIFPELKESEDERIRKALIELIQGLYNGCCTEEARKERDMFLAWLEKQGKNNMSISEATKQELEDNLNKALEKETPESCNEFLEKQGEQKTADKVESNLLTVERAKEISPFMRSGFENEFSAWSEEDEDLYTIANNFMPEPSWNAVIETKEEGSGEFVYDYNQMVNMFKAGVNWHKSIKP